MKIASKINKDSSLLGIGLWTKEEHARFLEALETYGKDYEKITASVATKKI